MPQKMLKPRVWVIVVAVLLMCTCVGSPLGILVAVLEGLRLRKIGKARIEAAIRSLTRGYPTPPVLPRPGPTENPANVQVAPFIREESLRAALATAVRFLNDDQEQAVALWEPDRSTRNSERLLITDRRTCFCDSISMAKKVGEHDFPHERALAVIRFAIGGKACLYLNGNRVMTVPAERDQEVRAMAGWIRAAIGQALPQSGSCPSCGSEDIFLIPQGKILKDLASLGVAFLSGLAASLLSDRVVEPAWQKWDYKRLLDTVTLKCEFCGNTREAKSPD